MDLVTMLIAGLVTSVHCVAMCGTLVLTYAVKDENNASGIRRMLPHLAYQGAKIGSYVLVGLLLGMIGAAFDLGGVRGYVSASAGLFMVLLGLSMTGRFPRLQRALRIRPPRFLMTALQKVRKRARAQSEETGSVSLVTPIAFGALTGLMPCGPLQAAQLYAAGTGSPVSGALAMLGFGLGTAPLMLGFGAVASTLGDVFKKRMFAVASLVIVVLGLVMLNRGVMLLGAPVTFDTMKAAVLGSPVPGAVSPEGAEVADEVTVVIKDVRFQPATLNLPAGRPVRLIVDRQEDNACSDEVAIPQLGIKQPVKAFGKTVIEIPAIEAGTYTLTCGMGMMSGSVVAGGAGTPQRNPAQLLATALLAGLALAVGYKVFKRDREVGASVTSEAAVILGFSPAEAVVIALALTASVMAGLLAGGALGPGG